MRVLVELAVVVVAFVALAIFLRALANLRSGSRMQSHERAIRRSADLELEKLQAEIDSTRRKAQEDVTGGKE
jgi:flagellar biosynthesis/type III secretory pathway M-ring protein FliF/YscJ